MNTVSVDLFENNVEFHNVPIQLARAIHTMLKYVEMDSNVTSSDMEEKIESHITPLEDSEFDYGIVGRNLSMIMNKKAITNSKLSEITGVGKNTIGYYRRGNVFPTSKALQRLAKGLGVEVGEFFKEIGDKNGKTY